MRAAVVHAPGGPEVLTIEDVPVPQPRPGWVLVRVRACGLNRSELMTRCGDSGDAVRFPRILGIECVGEAGGQTVIAAMGGMGRDFDGGYAEYALLPESQIIPVQTTLSWPELGAIPETFGTAWGSLETLQLEAGQTLLVRGATSSVGMAAITLAKARGVRIIATTRQSAKRSVLEANGADHVIVDSGSILDDVHAIVPHGADALLELVGTNTMRDSFRALVPGAHACLTGVLERVWDYDGARARGETAGIRFHRYSSSEINRADYATIFQSIVDGVESGCYRLNLDRVFPLTDIAGAHRYMEANLASGKVVAVP